MDSVGPPQYGPSQRGFKVLNGSHGDGIHHLLVKRRVAFSGRAAILGQQHGIFEIDRFVFDPRGVGVRDFQIFTDRSRLEPFPWDFQSCFVDRGSIKACSETWIDGVGA